MIDFIDLVKIQNVRYFKNLEEIEIDKEAITFSKPYKCFNGYVYNNIIQFQLYYNPITMTLHYVVLSYDNKKKLEKKQYFDDHALLYTSTNPFTTMFIGTKLADLKNYPLNRRIDYPFTYIRQFFPHKEQYIPMMIKEALEDYEEFDINTIEL